MSTAPPPSDRSGLLERPASDVAGDMQRRDTAWRRLDRRMLLVAPVDAFKSLLPAFVPALIFGHASDTEPWWMIALAIVAPVVLGVWSWATVTYRITSEQLAVQRGLLQRTTVTARLDRIRTVDITASPLQRLLRVAKVRIGTGSESPFELDGLSLADASALRDELLHVIGGNRVATDGVDAAGTDATGPGGLAEEVELSRFDPRWVRFAPFTLTGLIGVAAALGSLAQFFDEIETWAQESAVGHRVLDYVTGLALTALLVQGVALVLVVSTLAAVGTYVVRNWGYRLTRHPHGTLGVSRGLLTTRQTSVEERRLRGVVVSRPLLLSIVGGARADALVTGLDGGDDTTASSSDMLIPQAPRAEVHRVATDVLGDATPLNAALRSHGPAARRRLHLGSAIDAVVVAAVVAGATWFWEWPAWAYAVCLIPALLAPLVAEARYRRLGHALTGDCLVSRSGFYNDTTTVVRTGAIIGWNIDETFFQRRVGLVTLTATIAAGDDRVAVDDVPLEEAQAVIRAATPGLAEPFMTSR